MSTYRLSTASRILRGGGVIAYPTEAVWGLGCDPANEFALRRILSLKQRDADKGLILVAASMEQLAMLLSPLSLTQREQMAASWPGPTTWLVPHHGQVHPLVRGRFTSVALRVSAHPLVAALCKHFGGPLVSTSANPQGRPPAMSALAVRRYFGGALDYVLQGGLGGSARPSEIRDLVSGQIIRPS
jgi:L-threonylcarbamoyladenylate synthase